MRITIRYLALMGMLIWSLVHLLILPHFLETNRIIDAIIVLSWGELLLLLANPAAVGTWLENKIRFVNTVYALVCFVVAYLSYEGDFANTTVQVMLILGAAKLGISVLYRDFVATVLLFAVCTFIGVYQTQALLSPNFNPNLFLGIEFSSPFIPMGLDITIFALLVVFASRIVNYRILPGAFILSFFFVVGTLLISFGTWCALNDFNWLISAFVLGKGVVFIAIPAFTR